MMSISKKISSLLVMLLLGIAVNARSQRNYIRTDVMLNSSSMMSTGNQLKSVTDIAGDLTYSGGAMDLRYGASAAVENTL